MNILGIDTTTKFLCLGIYDGTRIYEYNLETGINLSALLIPTIRRIMDALDWRINDIDYFACGLGPGSFTGIRVGLATIKGLAWSLNKPIVEIPTLDILARNVKMNNASVMPIIDAKRNLIYTSAYKIKNGYIKRIKPYMLLTEKEFFIEAKDGTVVLGDAIGLYKKNILSKIKGVSILDKDYWYPKAHNIITLAKERINNKELSSSFDIKPIYLYPKECQIKSHQDTRSPRYPLG